MKRLQVCPPRLPTLSSPPNYSVSVQDLGSSKPRADHNGSPYVSLAAAPKPR